MAHQESSATDQAPLHDENGRFAKGNNPPVGFHTNPENRNPGGWVKEDTPRFKLERMMNMEEEELRSIAEDTTRPLFERKIARFIKDGSWREIKEMVQEVYGRPKESVDVTTNGESLNDGNNDPELANKFAEYLKGDINKA